MKFFLLLLTLLSVPLMAVTDKVVVRTQTTVTATTTSTKVAEVNLSRSYLLIQNQGATSVIVKFGSVQSGSEGVVIVAGGNYEPFKAPVESIYIKSASSTDAVLIVEGE